MTKLEHLTEMENLLGQGVKVTESFQTALEEFEEQIPGFQKLFAYYGSSDWYDHLAMEQREEIPPHQPRGVLSEDGIYNVILDCRDLAEHLRQLANQLDAMIDQE